MVYIPVDIEKAIKRECNRRRYSERTIKTYLYCINRFLKYAKKALGKMSKRDVRLFLEYLSKKGMAGSTLNVYHMAIRFLFEDVLDKRIWIDIRCSKVPRRLPMVLSKDETKRLFVAVKNDKHRTMLRLMYSAGLRVSELTNLKVGDIELDKNYGWVRGGMGNKDRLFIIAKSIKKDIREFMDSDANRWLFESRQGSQYTIRSLQQIVKAAAKKAGLKKSISCHTLRHSFATHLMEDGYSVSDIQMLLGHKSPETTFVYLHTSSRHMIAVKSPLDRL